MKKYRIYRSIRVSSINDVDFDQLGVSWAADEESAERFSEQFNSDYIIISAEVTADQINIAQTNAQWLNDDTKHESEVVLIDMQNIIVEYEGQKYEGRINDANYDGDESRPAPIDCDDEEVTDYLDHS